jgi:hypothetical protein
VRDLAPLCLPPTLSTWLFELPASSHTNPSPINVLNLPSCVYIHPGTWHQHQQFGGISDTNNSRSRKPAGATTAQTQSDSPVPQSAAHIWHTVSQKLRPGHTDTFQAETHWHLHLTIKVCFHALLLLMPMKAQRVVRVSTAGLDVIPIAHKPDQKNWATTDPHEPTGLQASAAAGLVPPLPTIVVAAAAVSTRATQQCRACTQTTAGKAMTHFYDTWLSALLMMT